MKRIPKTILAAAFLAAFAIGQEPDQDRQTPQDQNYAQPDMPPAEPTYVEPAPVYQPVQEPVQEPQEPVAPPQEPTQPTQPTEVTVPNGVEPPPLEIIDPSTIPDIGPTIKDWEPTPPGEMNPRTGIVEPDWSKIGTGIPDYSKPYDPDEDEELKMKKKEKCKNHRHGWNRHWDSDWEYCPWHPSMG